MARRVLWMVGLGLFVATSSAAGAQTKASAKLSGDPAAGKVAFAARCAACHGTEAQGTPMAPRLRGVFGKKAGAQSDQKYSAGLKASGLTWTPANLDAFLKAPGAAVKGTTMMVGVPGAKDRENLIAYLATAAK